MMDVVIVDSDARFAGVLRGMIEDFFRVCHWEMNITVITDPLTCLEKKAVYDIYFINISLSSLSGIDLVKELRKKHIDKEFIFVGEDDQNMHSAIYVKPRAYIRRKFLKEDMKETLLVLKSVFEMERTEIYVLDNIKNVRIRPMDIVYMESNGHYVDIWDKAGRKIIIRNRIKELMLQMEEYGFIRIHCRYLINVHYLKGYCKNTVILQSEKSLPVSRTYMKDVDEFITNWEPEHT